ncbi:hypothetical protein L2E82_51158 [Cichorium intybus]|nr:hypothetical protein L2E82_51158 [Cichorium intybus]
MSITRVSADNTHLPPASRLSLSLSLSLTPSSVISSLPLTVDPPYLLPSDSAGDEAMTSLVDLFQHHHQSHQILITDSSKNMIGEVSSIVFSALPISDMKPEP